jgi:hypothetical protein
MQIGGGADREKLGIRVSHVAEILAESIDRASNRQ